MRYLLLIAVGAITFCSTAILPATPPSAPPQKTDMLLHVDEQGRFALSDGTVIRLQAAISCCTEGMAKEDGWPLVTEAYIKSVAPYHVNLLHIRLGPFLSQNEGPGFSGYAETANGQYDLNRYDETFWSRVRSILQTARDAHIWVEVDVIDGWALRHDYETSPLAFGRNIQGIEAGASCGAMRAQPTPNQLDWTRKVAQTTGGFDNVLYQLSNESFACGVSRDWEYGIASTVRMEEISHGFVKHLIGTNSGRGDLEQDFDYVTRHDSQAVNSVSSKPTRVDEYSVDSLTPDQFRNELGQAHRRGTYFDLWRGQQDAAQWQNSLAIIKVYMEGAVPAVPAECPPLSSWRVKIHGFMSPAFVATDAPERGGYVTLDSTPFWGNGGPCNGEHAGECHGRRCEPAGGPKWIASGPDVPQHLESDGYLNRVGPLQPGQYQFKTCAPAGAMDQEIPPLLLDVSQSGCGSVRWEVQ